MSVSTYALKTTRKTLTRTSLYRRYKRKSKTNQGKYGGIHTNISIGMKKALDTIKKIGSHEKRITNDIVHNISRQIVNRTFETDALIVLGDIKHLRKREQNKHGRKFNRKLAGFQYFKLTQYIKYKASACGYKGHSGLRAFHVTIL